MGYHTPLSPINIKHFIAAIVLGIAMLSASSTPALATTKSERKGCGGYYNYAYGTPLKLYNKKGSSYGGQLQLKIYKKKVNGKWRYCALVDTPSNAKGKTKMMIKIGTRKQGNTKNKVTWNTSTRHYYDKGWVSQYIGGVALTPSKGRCAAVAAKMWKNGTVYKRKAHTATWRLCN